MTPRPAPRAGVLALSLVALGLCAVPGSAAAQQAGSIWPDHPKNLQVLPKDFPPDRLRAVMRGFTQALGVRCSHCHVGKEGAPLSTYDFAADDNPNKRRARLMYKMLASVNQQLKEVQPSGERVNMWCNTCHHGKARPQTLSEAVLEDYHSQGADSAFARFRELRSRYYGSDAYDFTADGVNALASQIFQSGDTATALVFFQQNVIDYPGYAEGYGSLGDVYAAKGDADRARAFYLEALEKDPSNERIKRALAGLG